MEVIIEADNVNVIIQGETNIEEFIVKEDAYGTLVSIGKDATISTLLADSRIKVQGYGNSSQREIF